MSFNKWTLGLAAVGAISLPAVAEETLSPVVSAVKSTTLSGYVDTSAIYVTGKGGYDVVGRSFDGSSKQNSINLNVVSVALEKPLDEGQWSAGYRVQMWLGPDANTLNSLSTTSLFGGGKSSDFALKNAYVQLRVPVGNGLDFKVGTFDTVIGYEVADAGNNPNYSRSFAFGIEPVIHTGVLASYKVNEIISLSGGIAGRGDVNNINATSGSRGTWSYLGSIALTAPESAGFLKGATLYAGVVDSGVSKETITATPHNATGTDPFDPLNLYAGATIPTPLKGLSIGGSYDYRANGLFDKSYENAVGGYLSFQATEKLKLNGRGEYATGSRGSATAAGAFGLPMVDNVGKTADNVKLLGVTGTVDYSLWANAITRLEVRWDHMLNGAQVLNDGKAENIISVALNVIYKF